MGKIKQYLPDDIDPVVGLKRHRRTKAIMYRLQSGRTANPKDYQGSKPSDEQYAAMRAALG